MSISSPFIRRPIATSLLAAAVLLAGILAYTKLPVAPLPHVDFPTIQVNASMPGASPETMASSVATPLERRFGRIAGLMEMTSTSSLGGTSITLQFDLDKNADSAARDVQAAIAAARGELPPNLPVKPTYKKVNPADTPTLIITLTSDSLPLSKVFDIANTVLVQKISQVRGVGQVNVGGGQQPAVRVQFDPAVIAGMQLTSADVRNAISATTANEAKGTISGKFQSSSLGANDQVLDARGYSSLVISRNSGATAQLGNVANVLDKVENNRIAGWADGKRAVLLMVFKQPDANIIETNERVMSLIPELANTISPAINIQVASDRTMTIRASVKDVEMTLCLSVLLVIIVVFAFLRSVRATIIPTVAMPLSLIGTFGVMWLLGYSVDNLSLMALTISTGFVVDDAIVVTENIVRAIELGVPPFEATLKGAEQIGFTILSITASLLAVFVPILLMGGIVGRLFREFAVTLSVAVAMSALVSLTVTPMMCAQILVPEGHRKHGWLYRASEYIFDRTLAFYERGLRWALRHRFTMLMTTLGTVGLSVLLFYIASYGLFPNQDTGLLMLSTEAGQDVSFAEMFRLQTQVIKILGEDPDIEHYISFIGSGGFGTSNTGRGFIMLQPKPKRKATADDVVARLRGEMSKIAGISVFLTSRQDVSVGGRMSRTQYQYTLQDSNLDELLTWAPRFLDALRKVPMLKDVNSDQQNAGLQLTVIIDRDTASRLGVTAQAIDGALYDVYGQRFVATTFTPLNEYHVVMEAAEAFRNTPDSLDNIYVRSISGTAVPLRAFAKVARSRTALSVNHHGQFPAITISFNLAGNVALGDAIKEVEKVERDLRHPPGIHADFQGTAAAFTVSMKNEPQLVFAALLTVYIVLGILYESYVHPITILSTLPSAGIGALMALMFFNVDLSIIATIGLLLLIGIVKKNAILLIDFAIEAGRKFGTPPEEAILRACSLRFRPILMTTFAALFGALPLAFGKGLGSELRQPLGITIVGGLLASQLLTLYTTPVVYLTLERLRLWVRPEVPGVPRLTAQEPVKLSEEFSEKT
ncbi:MAG: efflux RND transporter permease subunit [Candidatus Riflebacteria bacterium]|nr:efflux RND transporter permease subunit [Candidatus Riflebacteria bacterium]